MMTTAAHPHVTSDPGILGGEPCITGTRVPARLIAELVRDGMPSDSIAYFYPSVSADAAQDAAAWSVEAG